MLKTIGTFWFFGLRAFAPLLVFVSMCVKMRSPVGM